MKEKYFIDREISWIKFNERVLEEAVSEDNPLIERLRFISIFQSNYDEFFRVRVGSIVDEHLLCETDEEEKLFSKKLANVFKATKKLLPKLDAAYDSIMQEAEPHFLRLSEKTITTEEKAFFKRKFEREIAPFIAPFIIEKKSPFPFIDNATTIIGVTIKKKNGGMKFGFIPVRQSLPKAIFMSGADCRFMLIEDIISMFATKVFHKFDIAERAIFFIIRNSDVDEEDGLYDYDIDFRETMSKIVELRKKLAPVEVKYIGSSCEKLMEQLSSVLFLPKKQFFKQTTPLSISFLSLLEAKLPKGEYKELYYEPLLPQWPAAVKKGVSIIKQIQKKDLLLSYPFEDMAALTSLLDEAALHPGVKEIKISLYRVASNSRIVHALINAAKNGKSVICMVELRARFDEANNIDWSKQLEDAGCSVIYGLPSYKVHCKLLLIGFCGRERDIVHIGTGNFNESTAKLYTDLSLLTANRDIAADAHKVFDCLLSSRFVESCNELLVAPLFLKTRLIRLIDEEIEKQQEGKPAAVIFKLNSITDCDLVDKLVEASQSGVSVKMIVRGICCLVPGIPEYTENIQIVSIVGRFLEHSRIYAFGVGKERKYFISSADLMTRNTTKRLEVAAPVYDFRAKQRLEKILRLCLSDNVKSRRMTKSGGYSHVKRAASTKTHNAQLELFDEAGSAAAKSAASANKNVK